MILRDSAPHGPHLLLGLSAQRGSRIGLGPFGRCRPAAARSLPILRSMLRGIVEHCDVEQRRAHERVTEHRPERRLVEARVAGLPPHGGPGVNIFAIGRCAHGTRISRLPRPSATPQLSGALWAPPPPNPPIGYHTPPAPAHSFEALLGPPPAPSPRSVPFRTETGRIPHQDRFEAHAGHQHPRKVSLHALHSTMLRFASTAEPRRRADSRREQQRRPP